MFLRFLRFYNQGATNDIINRVEEIAAKRGLSMAKIATAWVLSKEVVTAPVVGSTNLDQLKEIIGAYASSHSSYTISRHPCFTDALDVQLTPEESKFLEEPYKPVQVIGHY